MQAPLGMNAPALLSLSLLARHAMAKPTDFSCNVFADTCPSKFDGKCDSQFDICEGGDCYDCDQCQQFHYDCNACISNGCYYCPGDALCFNSPYYSFNVFSHCAEPNDYTQETCSEPGNFFSDPMYSGQKWVFDLINVLPVWEEGYFGNGVRVRINDSGVQADHPEFAGRFDTNSSCDIFEPTESELKTDPAGHGTWVAGIVGGAAGNDECSVGIAPNVTLSSCYALGGDTAVLAEKIDSFDISQNSWGYVVCDPQIRRELESSECPFVFSDTITPFPCDVCDFSKVSSQCEDAIVLHCRLYFGEEGDGCFEFLDLIIGGRCQFNVLSEGQRQDLLKGITEGRDGKGIIFVFASGNDYWSGTDTNFQGFTNSRFVVSVGAVGKDGIHASYSTSGASIFISAPGGDFENSSNHITAALGGGCVDATSGTSFACPVVSGVIALVLEANPSLTWRDVQGILASTSRRVENDPNDDTESINAAGIWHSNLYGFGIVDADAAVRAAESWELYGPEKMLIGETGILNLTITDDASDPLYTSVAVSTDLDDFVVTSVAVYVDLTHFSRGHLEIVLTSPQGTASVLQPGMRPENTQLDEDERWKLLTVRSWGESPVGEWDLSIVDLKDGDVGACADKAWTFKIDGFNDATCLNMEISGLCEDGVLDPYDQLAGSDEGYNFFFGFADNGLLAEDACCACGGGTRTDDIIDQLRQWRLVIYGHSSKEQTGVPSTTPSVIPTDLSSVNPSSPPNYDPTSMPMFIPREKPTVPQLASNKIIESGAQCTHTKGSMFLVLPLLVLMCL